MFMILLIVVVIIALYFGIKYQNKALAKALAERKMALMKKYSDNNIVDKIINHEIWQGQSSLQVVDSIGSPLDCDEKVYKSKIKETWKYNMDGKNRYKLRIILEDGVVVGWDDKR